MTLVSCLLLSLALHAAALSLPVSSDRQIQLGIMRVTILPTEPESIGAAQAEKVESPTRVPKPAMGAPARIGSTATLSNTLRAARWEAVARATTSLTSAEEPDAQRRVLPKPSGDPELQVVAAEASAKISDSSVALASATANSEETHGGGKSDSVSNGTPGSGNNSRATGTVNGSGFSALGSASGKGDGSSGNGVALSQARYRETPRPDYPESARREGREGRVLLRVLVDDQGRSKQVEINSSSGSAALDRAAAEAIRRWRFHPARHGNQPVESWLRIPIEFRLAAGESR
jgi:protein TonB